jgi:hypothetical protein
VIQSIRRFKPGEPDVKDNINPRRDNGLLTLKGRLEEKDKQIEFLMKRYDKVEQFVLSIIELGQLKPKADFPPLK